MGKLAYLNVRLIVFLTGILLVFMFGKPAIAYDKESISNAPVTGNFELSPAMKDYELKQGDQVYVTIFVRNLTGKNLNLEIKANPVKGSPSTYSPWSETNYPAWIKPEINHVMLRNMEKLSFKATIKVPKDAPPGDHLEMVYVKTIPAQDNRKTSRVKTVSKLAAMFYITIPSGKLHTRTYIESFTTDKRFYSAGPVIFKFVLKNRGNVHGRLSGRILITNLITHKRTGKVDIPGLTIMANARKEIIFKYPLYRPMGRYKAELLLTEKLDKRRSRATVTFNGLPWDAIAAVLASGVFLSLLMVGKRKFKVVRREPLNPKLESSKQQDSNPKLKSGDESQDG